MEYGSKDIAKAAVRLAISENREEENAIKDELNGKNILSAAIDFGATFPEGTAKILERALVASKREGVIRDTHEEEGAVVGAAHEAIRQISDKAIGLNVGGKIAVARYKGHITVCIFFAIGMLNLNDVSIGLGHRAV